MTESKEKTIVSGMRPTGKLHLGHYHGVIENWHALQNDTAYLQKFFFVADWHCLTTEYNNTESIKNYRLEMVMDWLAFGIDPKAATLFVQSDVPQHAELHLILSMITPIGWLQRIPSYKDLQKELSHKDLSTYGFLGYPLLQTADVALYLGTHVPVGEDQVAHIELSREIIRRFNYVYQTNFLKEPQPLLTKTAKLRGTDGRKMSKSYHNSIFLSDNEADAGQKIMQATTDPARVKRTDPGNPEVCPVFDYHRVYSSAGLQNEVQEGCKTAKIGCVDCKRKLITEMNATLKPFREKRQILEQQKEYIQDILSDGANQAIKIAANHLAQVKEIMKIK